MYYFIFYLFVLTVIDVSAQYNHQDVLLGHSGDFLIEHLVSEYKPVTILDYDEAREVLSIAIFDLIILDRMMPNGDGIELIEHIKKFSNTPVIMLTAMNEDKDKIDGLKIGADDYLSKPFEPEELLLRIENEIKPEPAIAIGKGEIIESGVNAELDDLRKILKEGKGYLEDLKNREIERTGIPSLKIAHNNVHGFYLEVRNTHKNRVPEDCIRRQTLVRSL